MVAVTGASIEELSVPRADRRLVMASALLAVFGGLSFGGMFLHFPNSANAAPFALFLGAALAAVAASLCFGFAGVSPGWFLAILTLGLSMIGVAPATMNVGCDRGNASACYFADKERVAVELEQAACDRGEREACEHLVGSYARNAASTCASWTKDCEAEVHGDVLCSVAAERCPAILAHEDALALARVANLEKAAQAGNVSALSQLAWTLATSPNAKVRDGKKAVEHAELAIALEPEKDIVERTSVLAAAYAEAGRWDEAIATQNKANLLMVESQAPDAYVMQRLALYELHQPYRDH